MSRRDGGVDLADRLLPPQSRGNIVLFCGLGNHVDLGGLSGGGRSLAEPVCEGPVSDNMEFKRGEKQDLLIALRCSI
jgi:hypothetical protein